MAKFVVYAEDGRESVNSQKMPLVAISKRIVRPTTSTSNMWTYTFPLYKDPAIMGAKTYLYPYKVPYNNVNEEVDSLVFIRPKGSGNGVTVSTPYSNSEYIAYFRLADTGNPEKGLEVILTDMLGVARDTRYITCYADDDSNKPTWTMDTYIYSVSIVHKVLITNGLAYSFSIPAGERKEDYFVSVPLMAVWNADNGTDTYYEASEFAVQEIGGVLYFRVFRTIVNNYSSPRTPVYVYVAKIQNFISTQGS